MKMPTVLVSATLMTALAACATQEGALIHVTFEAGSIDHVEFIFARGAADIKIDLAPQLDVNNATVQRAYLRDYSAADSVTIGPKETTYDYLVPSNVAPAAEELFVVGYLGDKPVQIAHLTPHPASDHVNRYTAALVADERNLAAFGVKTFDCLAWKHGDVIDAITLREDHDCDGRAPIDDATCDVLVRYTQAPSVEQCDGMDSNSDCEWFSGPAGRLCKTLDATANHCLLGTGWGCSESPGLKKELPCDGPPPESTARSTNGICLDPLNCKSPLNPPFDLATATPDFDCTVFVTDGDPKGCNKFVFTALPLGGIGCPDPDFFDDSSLKLRKVSTQGGCTYDGEVIVRTPGQTEKNIAVMYPTGGAPLSVRRLSVFRLVFQTVNSCDPNSASVACHVHNNNILTRPLLQTCN